MICTHHSTSGIITVSALEEMGTMLSNTGAYVVACCGEMLIR